MELQTCQKGSILKEIKPSGDARRRRGAALRTPQLFGNVYSDMAREQDYRYRKDNNRFTFTVSLDFYLRVRLAHFLQTTVGALA